MNFCPYCGKRLDESMLFCPSCGKALTANPSRNDTVSSFNNEPASQQTATLPKKSFTPKKVLIPLLAVLVVAALAAVLILNSIGGNFSDNPDAMQKAANSVVQLSCYDYNNLPYSSGSGFAIFDKGIIVTNYHVIEGNIYSIEVQTESGDIYTVDSIIAYDEVKDIAILRVPDCHLTTLKAGSTDNLEKGQKIVAIGSPKGFTNTVSTGLFSNLWDMGGYANIQFSASISSGSSGGALFDDNGKVVGITTAMLTDAQDIYYAVPIEYAQELYDNSTPEDEMTVAEFYEQSEHPYTVDYVTAYGNVLHNQTVTVYGYISGMDANIFLVSSPDLVLHIDVRNNFDLAAAMMLRDLRSEKYAVEIDTSKTRGLTNSLYTGDFIAVEGTVKFYSSSDIRITATNITKAE